MNIREIILHHYSIFNEIETENMIKRIKLNKSHSMPKKKKSKYARIKDIKIKCQYKYIYIGMPMCQDHTDVFNDKVA